MATARNQQGMELTLAASFGRLPKLWSHSNAKKDEQRIALFYVMNDVVQRAKNKHMDVLIPAFQPAVLSAVSMGKSSPSVKQVMSRCIDIFGERQVFTEASVNVMKNMLQSEENGDGDESFAELDSEEVFRKIELFERVGVFLYAMGTLRL
ncbi:hypothetical protein ANCDUO_16550 [Ancylostoma duodenale]|uniref:CID domain-containing protein n=1 Tax=Ancylostoma duodenale TaxID=51022 RepID=A0A0C2G8J5_9BILA|nr:hypothetical protein ANCDUO_16550 [Ancylostoma duodenale]